MTDYRTRLARSYNPGRGSVLLWRRYGEALNLWLSLRS